MSPSRGAYEGAGPLCRSARSFSARDFEFPPSPPRQACSYRVPYSCSWRPDNTPPVKFSLTASCHERPHQLFGYCNMGCSPRLRLSSKSWIMRSSASNCSLLVGRECLRGLPLNSVQPPKHPARLPKVITGPRHEISGKHIGLSLQIDLFPSLRHFPSRRTQKWFQH